MGEGATQSRRGLWAATAMAGTLALAAGPASADAQAPDLEALRAEVRQLTELVQSISRQDQAQIQALSAQVKDLQARLAAEETVQTTPGPAQPRAAQNAARGFASLAGAPGTANSEQALPRVVQNAAHRFAMVSGDGQYSIGFTGDIQLDSGAYLDFHHDNDVDGPQALSNGFNARRARIGVTGAAFGDWGYALVYDAGNSQDTSPKGIETAQVVYAGLKGAAFEIGYSNTFFTLDQSTSSNDTLFMERASPSDIATAFNAGDARANAGVRLFGDRYWVGGYVTGPASGDSHTLTAERFGAFERAAVQAIAGPDYSLHLGVGVDELLQAPDSGNGTASQLTLSDQPELRIDPTSLLSTGALGTLQHPVTRGYVLDFETAATWRGLFWQGEYYAYQVDRLGLPTNDFSGAYGEVAWTITGETHPYNPQAAAYFRIVPAHPFSLARGTWGAWELGARVSYVDLDSNFASGEALSKFPDAVDGGKQLGYALDLNWYPDDFVRLILEFNRIDYDKLNAVAVKGAPLGAPIGTDFDALALRVQVAY